jgi:hypothetical protein
VTYDVLISCAIARVVSHQLPTVVAQVQSWVRSCGICGVQSGTGARCSEVFLDNSHFTNCSIFINHPVISTLYNRDTSSVVKETWGFLWKVLVLCSGMWYSVVWQVYWRFGWTYCFHHRPWRWRYYSQCQQSSSRLYGVTSRKALFFIFCSIMLSIGFTFHHPLRCCVYKWMVTEPRTVSTTMRCVLYMHNY